MIRVVAYNVSGGPDLAAAGRVLGALTPDIACVVEGPGSGRLRTLARSAGLEVAARAGRRGTGTAVLVAPDVLVRASSRVPLTTPKDVPTRVATHAIVSLHGLGLSVTAVQFGLRPEVRRTNLDELTTFLRSIDLPSVIGCDCNESVRSPVAAALASTYQDGFAVAGTGAGPTYPTADPSTRQDYVFVDPDLVVLAARVGAGPDVDRASHHRPVVVDLDVPPAADLAAVDAPADERDDRHGPVPGGPAPTDARRQPTDPTGRDRRRGS
jgi:endonuclease/exonuclease/phosphatase family metal-dependent hydrolase